MTLNSAIASRVDAVFADMAVPQHPGAALLVIDHGEKTYSKCYGLADLAAQRPITTDTSFYMGSFAKGFTAMAVMMLVERGKLSYDDRLPQFFPQFPAWGADITLRHMLHHISGLPDYFPFFSTAAPFQQFVREVAGITNQDVLDRVMALDGPEFPLGTQHIYHNTGYTLMAMIVAIVTGQSFADFLKANVFDSLGMKHTVVYDESRPARHNLALGYVEEEGVFDQVDYPIFTYGDGGIFSTLDDMFLWDQAWKPGRLLSKASLELAFTSGAIDGKPFDYGFGWYTNVYPGKRHVAHGGSFIPYNNYIVRFLDIGCTIVLLTNHLAVPGPRIRAHQVADILFRD